jgi:hypothetical protein
MNEIERAIRHGATAGGLRYWARKDGRAEAGLLKAAAHHSARAAQALRGVGGSPRGCSEPLVTTMRRGQRGA